MHKKRTPRALPALIAVLAAIFCTLVVGVLADGGDAAEATSIFYGTAWSLLPPVIAIVLALITKEVYSSLFVGILAGGLLYSNFSFEGTVLHIFNGGIVSVLSDGYNVGILIFLVIVIIVIFRLINGKLDQHSHKGEPNGKNNSKRNFLHFCQLGSRKAT